MAGELNFLNLCKNAKAKRWLTGGATSFRQMGSQMTMETAIHGQPGGLFFCPEELKIIYIFLFLKHLHVIFVLLLTHVVLIQLYCCIILSYSRATCALHLVNIQRTFEKHHHVFVLRNACNKYASASAVGCTQDTVGCAYCPVTKPPKITQYISC